MAKAEFLKEKAEAFLENAKYNISKKKWFLATFHLELAYQLYLKYYLFLKIADFPKTHSLRDLLADIGNVYQKEKEIKKLIKENSRIIAGKDEFNDIDSIHILP